MTTSNLSEVEAMFMLVAMMSFFAFGVMAILYADIRYRVKRKQRMYWEMVSELQTLHKDISTKVDSLIDRRPYIITTIEATRAVTLMEHLQMTLNTYGRTFSDEGFDVIERWYDQTQEIENLWIKLATVAVADRSHGQVLGLV